MSIDLKLEMVGAILFGERRESQSFVALALGHGHGGMAMAPHRPLLAIDAGDLGDFTGLPIRFLCTRKHRTTALIDLAGLDLTLRDANSTAAVLDKESEYEVADLSQLFEATIGRTITDPTTFPQHAVAARLFLESGKLSARTPQDAVNRDVRWRFDPSVNGNAEFRLTDRTIFSCRLADGVLDFGPGKDGQRRIQLKDRGTGPVRVRLTCLPELSSGSDKSLQADHFKMAYAVLEGAPKDQPVPVKVLESSSPTDVATALTSPTANCFNHVSARVA
jgi:hypothetical protein